MSTSTPSPSTSTQAPHVTWDEETIALHDAERGTRMKIEEPKTPYHYYGSDKEEAPAIQWDELQVKLQEEESKQQHQQQKKSEWDSSGDEAASSPSAPRFAERDAEGKKIEKDPKFAAKRKNHYNEFQAMKMWRQAHADEDEDDEDDTASKSEGKP